MLYLNNLSEFIKISMDEIYSKNDTINKVYNGILNIQWSETEHIEGCESLIMGK